MPTSVVPAKDAEPNSVIEVGIDHDYVDIGVISKLPTVLVRGQAVTHFGASNNKNSFLLASEISGEF